MQKKMNVKQYKDRNEEELEAMWDEIARLFSKPKSDRPKSKYIHETYGIPEATFYYNTRKIEFKQKIVQNCLNEAKSWMPELMEVLKEKSLVDKSEKSIEMSLKYIAQIAEKVDLTSKGKQITGFTYVTPAEDKTDEETA